MLAARLVVASCFVITPLAVGFTHRSPFIVPILGAAFVLPYALGKFRQWRAAWQQGGVVQIGLSALVTWPIQCVLVGCLYLMGLGLGRLFGSFTFVELSRFDWMLAATVMVVGSAAGGLIARAEHARLT